MSALSISNVKTRIGSKIHGTSVDKVRDFYGLCREAAGNILLLIDPKETTRATQITNALYDDVFSYVAPSDIKMDRTIDIRAQANRTISDNFRFTDTEHFDRLRENQDFTVDFNSLVKKIRISKSLTGGVTLNDCNGTTDNGTWAATSSAASLAQDTINYITGSASLKFTMSGATTSGYIQNSTFTSANLATYEDVGSIFAWVYFSAVSAVSSVSLRWGSSTTAYWSATVTAAHDATAFQVGWNLLRFDWDGATKTSTPSSSAINYARVTITLSSATTLTTVRVDSIVARLPSIYYIVYYSSFFFQNSSGTWLAAPTDDTDTINAELGGAENLFIYELGHLIAQELQGDNGNADVEYFAARRKEAFEAYGQKYKSDVIPQQSSYYKTRPPRRR